MDLQHGSDESAVLLLYQEAAYADLGTTTSEPVKETAVEPCAPVVFYVKFRAVKRTIEPAYMATAPPRRAA
jgi:hypothetical protein